eukprot:4679816-Alexandrium_andersonii.AAC.1
MAGDFGVPRVDWGIPANGLRKLRIDPGDRLGSGRNQDGVDHLLCNSPRLRAHCRDLSPEPRKIALQGSFQRPCWTATPDASS